MESGTPSRWQTHPPLELRFEVRYDYPVVFTRDVFHPGNDTLRQILRAGGARRHRALVAIDGGLLAADTSLPERIQAYADASAGLLELLGHPLVVRGGEICKGDGREVDELYGLVEQYGVCRHSFVFAVGGGSVLDAIGLAAATAHRGIRLIRFPSTVLAQNDAGIGVKNAINFNGRKNFVGTFAPPFAVINDADFLRFLGPRDLRSGLAEAVKVALIRDRDFFASMWRRRHRLGALELPAVETSIHRCAELHLRHIGTSGDPFELGTARPLDFGHWSAHKLEELSGGDLRHGEAVAIGIALDSIYSQRIGRLAAKDLERILTLLLDLGFELRHPSVFDLDVGGALEEFREHIGGQLTITLLDGVGRGFEASEIDADLMAACLEALMARPFQPQEIPCPNEPSFQPTRS